MAFKGQIIIDTERCKGCGVCVPVCPMKCIALS
ncbi:MAG: 4Fe-4S binding protein, partial [Bacteroidales bacterium]|nr:4Fe-4S binding protein [Bacteroidales bacterium]